MYGLNHKTVLETCVEVMSIKRLNCVQAVDKFYDEFYGFSILKPLGLHRTRKLKEYAKENGGFESAMGQALTEFGFIPDHLSEGSIVCCGDRCLVYVGGDYYAQTTSLGNCAIMKIDFNDVKVWSWQTH